MSEGLEVMLPEGGALAPRTVKPEPMAGKVMSIIERMTSAGNVSADTAVALKEMTNLVIQMRALDAKQAFAEALKGFQTECKPIEATSVVRNKEEKGGGVRYRYAEFPDLMQKIQPIADKWGFVIQFTEPEQNEPMRIGSYCILTHVLGHSERYKYSVRIGKGPIGCNDTQADGAAHTYAKRGSLCSACNIVIDKDTDGAGDDAALEGPDITQQQALSLMKRVRATGSDEFKFLKLAMGTTLSADSATQLQIDAEYSKIPQAMFAELDAFLTKRERIQASKK